MQDARLHQQLANSHPSWNNSLCLKWFQNKCSCSNLICDASLSLKLYYFYFFINDSFKSKSQEVTYQYMCYRNVVLKQLSLPSDEMHFSLAIFRLLINIMTCETLIKDSLKAIHLMAPQMLKPSTSKTYFKRICLMKSGFKPATMCPKK